MVNYGWETFQGISFDIFLMEYRICNPELYNLTLPRFFSVAILTENIEIYNNGYNGSHRLRFYKHEQGANSGSKKRLYSKIFMVGIYDYKIWEVVFPFMFIFDQARFSTD